MGVANTLNYACDTCSTSAVGCTGQPSGWISAAVTKSNNGQLSTKSVVLCPNCAAPVLASNIILGA